MAKRITMNTKTHLLKDCREMPSGASWSEGNMAQIETSPMRSKPAKLVSDSFKQRAVDTLKVASVVSSLFFASSSAFALGLGVLDVQSNLDQPLNGFITVNVATGDDVSTLTAQVASPEEFETLGLDYPSYLNNIKLDVERSGEGVALRVSSDGIVIKEPFIHFLVKVNWAGGNFLREYTALIDPPIYAAETPRALAKPKPVGTDQSYTYDKEVYEPSNESTENQEDGALLPVETIDESTAEEYSDVAADTSNDSMSPSTSSNARYGPVASGESLSLIAQELQRQVPDLSIYAIMKILHEDNPDAFINGNINGLLKGSVLTVRDINQIRNVDSLQARRFFHQQSLEWDQSAFSSPNSGSNLRVGQDTYSSDSELFGSASSYADSELDSESFQVGGSEEDTFFSAIEGDTNEGETLALRQEISQLQTSLASSDLENQELSERIALLEGQLADMNKFMKLSVEDADFASLEAALAEQNRLAEAGPSDASEDYTVSESLVNSPETELPLADDVESSDDLLSEFLDDSIESIDDESAGQTPAETSIDEFFADEPNESADTGINGSDVDVSALEEVAGVPSQTDNTPVVQRSEPAESLLDKIGGITPIAGGLGALLLGGIGLFLMRRRRADEEFEISMLSIQSNSQSIDIDTSTDTQSGLSASMSASVAQSMSASESTDQETSFLTVYSDSDAVVQADEVDPIAEADVYIAYGRDEQAEEVLLDGIASHPDRIDVKRKLVGLYFKNKNAEGFERIAEELYTARDSMSGDSWQEISDMGSELVPENPLFKVSGVDFDVVEQSIDSIDDKENSDYEGVASPSDVEEAEEETLVFDTALEVDESDAKALGEEAKQALEFDDEVSELIADSGIEDASVQLINFDEGRSEISELDEVEIGDLTLDTADDGIIAFDMSDDDEPGYSNSDETVELDLSENFDDADDLSVDGLSGDDLVIDFDSSNNLSDVDEERDFSDVPEVSDMMIDPDYDEAQTQYELAKVFVDLGDNDGAKKILEDLVADSENSNEIIRLSKELLDSMNG